MSGRRWKAAITAGAKDVLGIDATVVLGGPANSYTHYIATEEEYSVQRYEGASTLYGPNTLAAYLNLTVSHLSYLNKAKPLTPGPSPPININTSYSFITGVVVDNPGLFREFGECLSSPDEAKIHRAGDVVSSKFVAANPRNNLRLEGTYAIIEKYDLGAWKAVRNDDDWFLTFNWKRTSTALGTSEVTIEWEIEPGTGAGMYRMRYYGDSKSLAGNISPFDGACHTFNVDGRADGFFDDLI